MKMRTTKVSLLLVNEHLHQLILYIDFIIVWLFWLLLLNILTFSRNFFFLLYMIVYLNFRFCLICIVVEWYVRCSLTYCALAVILAVTVNFITYLQPDEAASDRSDDVSSFWKCHCVMEMMELFFFHPRLSSCSTAASSPSYFRYSTTDFRMGQIVQPIGEPYSTTSLVLKSTSPSSRGPESILTSGAADDWLGEALSADLTMYNSRDSSEDPIIFSFNIFMTIRLKKLQSYQLFHSCLSLHMLSSMWSSVASSIS